MRPRAPCARPERRRPRGGRRAPRDAPRAGGRRGGTSARRARAASARGRPRSEAAGRPSRRRPRRPPTGSSGTGRARPRRPPRATRDPRRRAHAEPSAAGSRRSGVRPARRTRRTTCRRWRSPRRRARRAGEEDRRIDENELRDELRSAGRQLEGEPPAERVSDEDRLPCADGLDDRVAVRGDVPRGLPRRVPVAEEIGREDVVLPERRGERREVAAVVADAVEADDAECSRRAELVERERHSGAASTSSESGTISSRPRRVRSRATRSPFPRCRSGTCHDAARRSPR